MKHFQIYIIEAKGQNDEIHTPSLYTYKVYGSLKEAQEELDSIYNVLRQNKDLSPTRDEFSVTTRETYPRQYWQIVTKFVSISE